MNIKAYIVKYSSTVTGILLIVFGIAGIATKQIDNQIGISAIITGLADLGVNVAQIKKAEAMAEQIGLLKAAVNQNVLQNPIATVDESDTSAK